MDAAAILLALLVAGVNFGWQPADDGSDGLEYIVQVEPELLDALARGEAVPIESNVPPDVGPIRKVSIVVGRDEVPRKSLGAVNHTAYFAGQGSGAPGQSSPATSAPQSMYDRYGSPSGVLPPPSVLERAQAAATETANTLQDGIDAGIQAANQQLSRTGEQMLDSTRNASEQFGQQLQAFARDPAQQFEAAAGSLQNSTEQALGAIGDQLQQVSNPFTTSNPQSVASAQAQSNVTPPPWSTNAPGGGADLYGGSSASQAMNGTSQLGQSAPVRTPTGWTTIGSNVAAPPLIVPQMSDASNQDVGLSARMASNDGPGFPSTTTGQGTNGYSANSSPPPGQNLDAASNWANSGGMYNNTAVETGRGGAPAIRRQGLDSNLVAVDPIPGSTAGPQQPASQPFDLSYGADMRARQGQMATATDAGSSGYGAPPADATRPGATAWIDGSSSSQGNSFPFSQPGQSPFGNFASQSNTGPGTLNEAERDRLAQQSTNGSVTSATSAEPPWIPFVLVCLTLVGSLSANFFLGWSYLDARQRYRLLVRKTAETFRRVASPAA
jgi:hypothetical protein